MLKRLAILGLLLAVVGSAPIPGQTTDHGSQSSHNPKDQATNSKTPTQPTITLVGKNCQTEQFKDDSDRKKAENDESSVSVSKLPTANVTIQSNPKRDEFDWLAYWASIALLVVAGVTLWWFIVQTNATKDAAEAALLNVKALIISERPWFVVNIESKMENFDLVHVLSFTNRGRTPAELVELHCDCQVQPVEGFTPPEVLNCPLTHPNRTLFFTDDPVRVREVHPDGMLTSGNKSGVDPRTVYVFGRILYWDKFTDRSKPGVKPYLTQWCFHYIPGTGDVLDRFVLTPNRYNKHT